MNSLYFEELALDGIDSLIKSDDLLQGKEEMPEMREIDLEEFAKEKEESQSIWMKSIGETLNK